MSSTASVLEICSKVQQQQQGPGSLEKVSCQPQHRWSLTDGGYFACPHPSSNISHVLPSANPTSLIFHHSFAEHRGLWPKNSPRSSHLCSSMWPLSNLHSPHSPDSHQAKKGSKIFQSKHSPLYLLQTEKDFQQTKAIQPASEYEQLENGSDSESQFL